MACGCNLLVNGQPASWADAGLTLAERIIRERGWEDNREALQHELSLVNHFQMGPASYQDDELNRIYSMDLMNTYVEAPEFKETHTDSTKNFSPNDCMSTEQVAAIIADDSHTACSPRGLTVLASGSEEFRGKAQYIQVEDKEHCIWEYRGKNRGLFAQYIKAMTRGLSRAAMRIRDWNIFVTMQKNGWNSSIISEDYPAYTLGSIPHTPDSVFTSNNALMFEEHLRGNDFAGEKVWHMHERVARSWFLSRQFNGSAGFQVQAMNFMGPQIPEYSVGKTISVDGITVKIADLPFGYIKQTGPSTRQFVPIDRRLWKAVNRGVRAFSDSRYQGSRFTDNSGVSHDLVSPIWAAAKDAYSMRPIGLDASTPVTNGAEAWSIASSVKFIGGAFLQCNENEDKFKPRLKQAWKMDPEQPRATAILWSRLPGYEMVANRIGLDPVTNRALAPVGISPGCPVDGLTCAEEKACATATALPLSYGVFTTECRVEVEAGTLLLKVCVTRTVPAGYAANGIVSLDYATAPGTATAGAGNEYTTTSGTLSWADKECGTKCFNVTLLSTATPGTQFNINYSNVLPAPQAAVLLPNTSCTTTVVAFPALPEDV